MSKELTTFKSFKEMNAADYAAVGFKSGLEVHQQLLTRKKLFCRCPAGLYSETYHAEILRHMRPTLSELGEYDGTALMEFKTKKDIIYQINKDSVCTYEFDDTPPFPVNEEALDIALEIAMLLECQLVDEIHISRKQYLDGSIPTGFQRTTIVGVEGKISFKDGRNIRVIQLALEEDACREFSDRGHLRVYRTDRLGMPLIEVVTYPDMKTPQEVAEVGQLIRMVTRSTNKVRRGIGAARQDVNVSVEGGTRVEIKGVPRIPLFPILTYNEARRQWSLLRIREVLHARGITKDSLEWKVDDLTGLLKGTGFEPLKRASSEGALIRGVVLKGFTGILRTQTQSNAFFWKEISDRVRVVACLTELPNLIHSDLPDGTISRAEWKKIMEYTRASKDDAVIVVWGGGEDIETAVNEIVIRAREAAVGVPSETRQALADGTNGFERILPGPDRMYPDTDSPPIQIDQQRVTRVSSLRPGLLSERRRKYSEMGLSDGIAEKLLISPFYPVFDEVVSKLDVRPVFAADILVSHLAHLRRKGLPVEKLDRNVLFSVFQKYQRQELVRYSVKEVLTEYVTGDFSLERILANHSMKVVAEEELQKAVDEVLVETGEIRFNSLEKRRHFLMGQIMSRLRRDIEGRKVYGILKKRLD